MKLIKIIAALLTLALALSAGAAGCADVIYGPGLNRTDAAAGYDLAWTLAERYGVPLTEGMPLYQPTATQPLNAYLSVDPDCQVGIDGDDMRPVDQVGLVPEITGHLENWIEAIQAASGGAIRFVEDPDAADVLVSACQSFKPYGEYSGGGLSAEGYACTVTLIARQLSSPDNRCAVSATATPPDTVTLRGNGRFWKTPPALAGTDGLLQFVRTIMGWYGYGAQKGAKGAAVKRLQQRLKERAFLKGAADGSFGPATQAAVKALQEAYGLEKTGAVDVGTLVAAYYDRAAVDALS